MSFKVSFEVRSPEFLNNDRFFTYLDKCRKMGVLIPVIPGLKLMSNKSSLLRYKNKFNINVPVELERLMMQSIHPDEQILTGIQWLFRQCINLINAGEKHLHIYVFSDEEIRGVLEVLTRLRSFYKIDL